MNGKDTCKILKQIRRDIAKANDIGITIRECRHKGDCAGTCPACEAEVQTLERALAERRRKGRQVTVAGISAGLVAITCASCGPRHPRYDELMGDIPLDAGTTDEAETETEAEAGSNSLRLAGIIAKPEAPEVSDGDMEAPPEADGK